jgi:hypothetical protein
MADRRVIQLLFKIGKCLAFTPFSLTGSKPSRFQKIYKSAILTLYTAVTIYTWYTRMIFYVDLTKIPTGPQSTHRRECLRPQFLHPRGGQTRALVYTDVLSCKHRQPGQTRFVFVDSPGTTCHCRRCYHHGTVLLVLQFWLVQSLLLFLRSCPQLLPIFLQRFDWRHLENDLGKVQVPNCTGSQSGTFVKVKTQLSRVDMCDSRF